MRRARRLANRVSDAVVIFSALNSQCPIYLILHFQISNSRVAISDLPNAQGARLHVMRVCCARRILRLVFVPASAISAAHLCVATG